MPESKKIFHGVETHLLSGKEKLPGTAASKEGHADIVLRYIKENLNHWMWQIVDDEIISFLSCPEIFLVWKNLK